MRGLFTCSRISLLILNVYEKYHFFHSNFVFFFDIDLSCGKPVRSSCTTGKANEVSSYHNLISAEGIQECLLELVLTNENDSSEN